jgi:DNA repair photolyase
MELPQVPSPVGRGSRIQPVNRFTRLEWIDDLEYLEYDEDARESRKRIATEYFADASRSVVTSNNSPDVFFNFSLNPYRGCSHGCSYCYARPTHEYFDLSAGIDFETKIFVKEQAPALFRDFLAEAKWKPETIVMSGVTDCYQPAEKTFRITRGCLEVALEARQPISIVTKNVLILRDLDLLREMAKLNLIRVAFGLTTLDQSLTKIMEPRTSSPSARLRAIAELTTAGVPTHALCAPLIPGLTDSEVPSLLKAAKEAGAMSASYILLRLPGAVKPVFLDWIDRYVPEKRTRIESRIRQVREGKLNVSEFGSRMKGTGEIADQIERTFKVFAKRLGLDGDMPPLDGSHFRRPTPSSGQGWLFGDWA